MRETGFPNPFSHKSKWESGSESYFVRKISPSLSFVDVSFCPVQALVDVRISDSSEAEVVKISAEETEELVQVSI